MWPLARLAAGAFTSPGAFREVLAAGRYRTSLVNSLALSTAAAFVSVALALVPAWVFARERFPGRNLARTAVSLPLTFSGVLVGFLVIVMLGRIGAVPKLAGLVTGRELFAGSAFTLGGLFVAYLYFEIPRAVMTLEAAFRHFPPELDAAARSLGAGPVARLFRVTLPYAAPALFSTLAVTFSASMGSFGVALVLSRRFTVAPLEIYTELTAFLNDAVAGALCVALAALTFGVDRLLGAEGGMSLPVSPRRVARTAGIAVTAALAVGLVAPLVVTAAGAFVRADWYGQRSEGAAAGGALGLFRYVLGLWSGALVTSLRLVGTVVPLALLIGTPAAFAFRRRPFPGSGSLETLAMTPLAIPGIALAVGLLLGAGRTPRFGLLVAGHLAYTLPLVLKTVSNALEGESPDLERAARSLGAGPWKTAAWVTLPRLVPGLVLSALLVFAVSWGEFNVSFLLATPLVQTFPAGLYLTYTTNSFPVAAAATLIFLAPVLPAFLAIQALGGEEFRRGLSA